MDTEVVKCAAQVRDRDARWPTYLPCSKRGTLEHDGKRWCKTHHPPTRAAKSEAKEAAWRAKWNADRRAFEQKARDAADIPKFRDLAKRAAELVEHLKADGVSTFGVVHDLAEMHKEAP